MKTISQIIGIKFQNAILAAYPDLKQKIPLEVVESTQEKFGHYQCNSAMKLTKILGAPPRAIAEKLVSILERNDTEGRPVISEVSIAGPGFINVTLDPHFLSRCVNHMLLEPHLGIELPLHPKKIVIDFSSPNTAKEMHVGHLRSTIIGDCLARLFEFLGHDVLRLNHIGDWGTAFGMLITYMKQQAPQILNGEQETNLSNLVAWYKASKQHFDQDPKFKKDSQLEVVALQSGNKEALKSWEIICDISRTAYQEIYDLLGIKLTERGESFYNPMLADTVAELEKKGLITLSDGAKCIFIEGFQNREGAPLPLMLQKSDGGYNYDTTDMAAIKHRITEEKADRIIYVTDAGQSLHFRMIFKAAEMAGYLDPKKVKVDHVPFGMVLGADGKKFRTRSGETEKLIDLIDTAIKKANEILEERGIEISEEDRNKLAHALGINAIKYADLSCNRIGDYTFSYEKMLRFEGNTAAFLMYAFVRIEGIKRKINASTTFIHLNHSIHLNHPSEITLGLHLARFGEILESVSEHLLPNQLSEYLYLLSEKFNAFFRDCRVEGTPEQSSRLLLCELTSRVLEQGMEILGLKTVDRM